MFEEYADILFTVAWIQYTIPYFWKLGGLFTVFVESGRFIYRICAIWAVYLPYLWNSGRSNGRNFYTLTL
uniref:Uncharacterized protein n=1 Tax=Glossina palpalis gambiensis TaxID=67801 RepID=A0A1B0C3M9_9MUSC